VCKDLYTKEGTPAGVTFPDHLYGHGSGSSVIGGPTYTGGPYPDEFDGDVLFGDYVQGFIKRLELDGAGKPTGTKDFVTGWFGVDIELRGGEVYYVNFGDGGRGSGSVVRIAYSPNNSTPIAVASATPTFGTSPLKVTFKGSGSSDPDGDALKYEWDFGDGTAKSTAKDPVHTYMKGGNFDARLKVTDPKNASSTATVRISVNNAPPVVTLTAPLDGGTYRNGVPVELSGSATDPDDGSLSDSRLSWDVLLVHGTHVHPFQTLTGKKASFTPTTDHDADSFYRVTLTATDSDGLSAAKTVVIRPASVGLSITSEPSGAPISYAGYSLTAPHTAQAAIGFHTTVSAAQSFVAGGRTYEFTGWSDGGAIAHDVTIPATDLTLVARYRDTGPVVQPVGGFGPGPGADKAGPRISLRRAGARRLAGKVSDPSGVRSLKVALRARKRRGGCRWWSTKLGRLARKDKNCAKPRWIKATLRPRSGGTFAWSLAFGKRLPKGRYTLAFRAVDGAGNTATALVAGRRSLRIGK
jgi:PKD repeat protein